MVLQRWQRQVHGKGVEGGGRGCGRGVGKREAEAEASVWKNLNVEGKAGDLGRGVRGKRGEGGMSGDLVRSEARDGL